MIIMDIVHIIWSVKNKWHVIWVSESEDLKPILSERFWRQQKSGAILFFKGVCMRLMIESFVQVDDPSLPSFVFFFKVAVSQKALLKSLGSPIQKIRLGMVRLFLMIFCYIAATIQLVKLKSLLLKLYSVLLLVTFRVYLGRVRHFRANYKGGLL